MEENQTFIPEGWAKQKGDNLFKVQGGYAFKSNDYKDEGVLLVRISNVGNNNFIYKDLIYVPKRFLTSHSNFLLNKDDVLMGLTGDLGKICILENGEFPFILNQRVGRFIFNEKVNNRFLYYLISSSTIQNKFDAFFTGGAQKNISPKQIESVEYIVPKSTTEQETIANILSKTDQAIANTEALIAKYTQIKTGLMQDLLTKGIDDNGNIRSEQTHEFKDSPLGRIPKEWEYCKMGSFIEANLYGPRFSANDYSENGNVKTIRGTDFSKSGEILYNETPIAKLPPIMIKNHRLFNGDIVIVTTADCGLTAVFEQPDNDLPFIPSAYSVKFRFNKVVYPYYLKLFMTTTFAASQVYKFVRQGTLGNLPGSDILDFDFVLPNEEEQHRIVNTIQKQEDFIVCEKNKLSKLQSLKTGLMQDLLSGKVRVNNLKLKEANETALA